MNTYTFTTTDQQDSGLEFLRSQYLKSFPPGLVVSSSLQNLTTEEFLKNKVSEWMSQGYTQYIESEAEKVKQSYISSQTSSNPEVTDLEIARQNKLTEIFTEYSLTRRAGITPTGMGFVLAAEESDQSKFSQLITLLRELQEQLPSPEAKTLFENSPFTISDIDEIPHTVTVKQLREIIIDYGIQINSLWSDYATKRSLVNQAVTIEEIESIGKPPEEIPVEQESSGSI